MAVSAIEDLISPEVGARYDETKQWCMRKFLVQGLTPGPGIWGQAAAYVQSNYGIFYGNTHPTIPGIVIRIIDAKPYLKSRTACVVYVTYQTPQFFGTSEQIIRFTSSTRMVKYSVDNSGNPLLNVYYPPGGGIADGITWIAEAEEPCAYAILEYEFSATSPPSSAFLQSFNCLNTTTWNGGSPKTWWFSYIFTEENVFTGEHRTIFRFEYDPLTHLQVTSYRDINGNVPTNVAAVSYTANKGNGWCRVTRRGTSDFSSLPLRIVL